MTKVVTVQEAIRTVFATLLSTKIEIPDTINIANNDDNVLDEGWGLVIGEVEEPEIDVLCNDRTRHNYSIIITKWIPRLDHDADLFHTKMNELSEDARTVRQKLVASDQLGIENTIDIVKHTGTASIAKVGTERGTILFIEVKFYVEISEERT